MPSHNLDLRLFHYALTSAEHGSFRRAAATLNVQQSTVSRGVSSLEHLVGTRLFERGHAGIRPTFAGDRFLEEARLGFEHLKRAVQRATEWQRGEQGELIIGVSLPFSVLGDLLRCFRNRHDRISVEIVESTSGSALAMLRKRSIDVAFVGELPRTKSMRSLRLRNENLAIAFSESHRLAYVPKVSFEDICHERFILTTNGIGPDLQKYLVKRLIRWETEPHVQLHRVGQCDLINMVALGFGVTILFEIPPSATTDGIIVVPLAGRNVMSLHAVWLESNPNPALRALLDIARAAA